MIGEMACVEGACGVRRRGQLVVTSVSEPDRGRHQLIAIGGFGHEGHHQPGIDTARQKRSQGHFTLEALADGTAQHCLEIAEDLRRRPGVGVELLNIPIFARGDPAIRQSQPVAGLQLAHVTIDGVRGQVVSEREVALEAVELERVVPGGACVKGLDLTGEMQRATEHAVKERLLPNRSRAANRERVLAS